MKRPAPIRPAQSPDPRHTLGKQAEEMAAEAYLGRGARIVARNFRARGGELDLVVEEAVGDLVIVEVRARTSGGWVSAAESVDWRKRKKILHTAQLFLMKYRGPACAVRFDLYCWDGIRVDWVRNIRLD